MKTISVINLKGGVAKTTTAVNMAALFAEKYKKSVLLIDNDPQGNASRFFNHYYQSKCGSAKILDEEAVGIWHTQVGIDVIDANMTLLEADNNLRSSAERQDNRIKNFLKRSEVNYDFCIIDNPPAILMCTINALCSSDEVIIPVTLDNWALDGVEIITEQIEELKVFNEKLKIAGILLTNYKRSIENEVAEEWLRKNCGYKVFETKIRYSAKVPAATYYKEPLEKYSPRSAAAVAYRKFVHEYLQEGDAEHGI